LVYSPKKLVALVGIKDLIIVETKDALLICKKGSSQKCKKNSRGSGRKTAEEISIMPLYTISISKDNAAAVKLEYSYAVKWNSLVELSRFSGQGGGSAGVLLIR